MARKGSLVEEYDIHGFHGGDEQEDRSSFPDEKQRMSHSTHMHRQKLIAHHLRRALHHHESQMNDSYPNAGDHMNDAGALEHMSEAAG